MDQRVNHCRPLALHRTVLLALAFSAMLAGGLSGCGKKGPLYLPDEKPSAQSRTPD